MIEMEYEILPLDLLEIVRQSLQAFHQQGISSADETFDPRSPALRKLVEQVLFSRRFILTYYGVLGVLVATFAVNHWYEKRKRWTKRRLPRRRDEAGTPTSNASSDTTLLPSEAQSVKDVDTEQTPLLHSHAALQKIGSSPPTMVRHLRRFLMHNPSPIPALTAPTNHLPSNSTTLVVLLLLAVNLFYLFYHMPLTIPMLFAFADRASLCFVVNLPVLYVLAAKTNQPLQFLTGWSYEGLNLFHRRLGEWMVAFAALHGVGMVGVWYTLLRPLHFGLIRFLTSRVILLGIFALFVYLTLYITSIGWIRRLYYETFLGLHIVLQVAALALLFFHHHGSRPYVLASLAIWVLDRVLGRLVLFPRKLVATLQVAPDQRTVLLFCDVPVSRPQLTVKLSICHGWQPGQHVFVTVPGLGWRHKLQAHPFTIAFARSSLCDEGGFLAPSAHDTRPGRVLS